MMNLPPKCCLKCTLKIEKPPRAQDRRGGRGSVRIEGDAILSLLSLDAPGNGRGEEPKISDHVHLFSETGLAARKSSPFKPRE
jgi:hypothetical protein